MYLQKETYTCSLLLRFFLVHHKTAFESESITLSPDNKHSYRVQNAICWDILGDLRLLCEEDNNNTTEEDALVFFLLG
jgi:hypothetical protein